MKAKYKTVFLAALLFSLTCTAQSGAGCNEKKNAYGFACYSMNHQLTRYQFSIIGSFNPDFNALHTNSSVDFAAWYKREFKLDTSNMRLYSKVNFMMSYKFGDVQINPATQARVYEEFFEFPVLFGLKISAGKAVAINLGFGLNYSILSKQKFFPFPGEILPPEYLAESKFGAYSKLGFAVEMGASLYVSKRVFFDSGLWSDFDFDSPLQKSNSVPLTTVYRSFGTFAGLGMTF